MIYVRTCVFYLCWIIVTIFWSFLIIGMVVLPFSIRHRIATCWSDTTLWLLRIVVNIRWEVKGCENIPDYPVVIVMNHQSAWETIFSPMLTRKQVWVLKKELMRVPFFGWAMALLHPIAINRSNTREAMRKIIAQGKQCIHLGYSIVMFPEGHRFPLDAPIVYRHGAFHLAMALNAPILPIAHNAGQFWPRPGWWLRPGTIQVRVGAPVTVSNKEMRTLIEEIQSWTAIERDRLVIAEKTRHNNS